MRKGLGAVLAAVAAVFVSVAIVSPSERTFVVCQPDARLDAPHTPVTPGRRPVGISDVDVPPVRSAAGSQETSPSE